MLTGTRVNTLLLTLVLIVGLAILAMLAADVRGGPLDPPGPPGSTDGVREPGTPISSVPFTINTGGRYYLTRNLTGSAGQSGVTIAADNVTLDLGGFTLVGVNGSVNGVFVSGARTGITIEGGTIRGWFNGIDATAATYSRVVGTAVIANGQALGDGSYGILIGESSVVRDCQVSINLNHGIYLGPRGRVHDCSISQNGGSGVLVNGYAMVDRNSIVYNGLNNDATGGVVIQGNENTIRENMLGNFGDVVFADTYVFNTIIDNTTDFCGSIVVPPSNFAPKNGVVHSNVGDDANGYC
ncbi:MAG TPA: hypothetical protein VJ777_26370 [Mycobacterium sp.]|nr:hypothetical protein [Mycobacterium sp.]